VTEDDGATLTSLSAAQRGQDLLGQTVVVIGGSAGIGLETARLARDEGAELIITARNPERLERVGQELGASFAAFDASDFDQLEGFFDTLSKPIDHVLLTGPGPYYAPLAELDLKEARRDVDTHLMLPILIARQASGKVVRRNPLMMEQAAAVQRPALRSSRRSRRRSPP
jgi:NAD(P)-dependent dehydrogenase (short-subunit alcohol dehydrogenase family)